MIAGWLSTRVRVVCVVAVALVGSATLAPAMADEPTTTEPVTTVPTTIPSTTAAPATTEAPLITEAPQITEPPRATTPSTETTVVTTIAATTQTTSATSRPPVTSASTSATTRGAAPTTSAPRPATTERPGTTLLETAPAPVTTALSSSSISPFTTPRRATTTAAPVTTGAEIGPTTEITASDPSRMVSFFIIVLLGLLGAAVSVTSRRTRSTALATPSVLDGLPVGFDFEPVVRPVPLSAVRVAAEGSDDLASSPGDHGADGRELVPQRGDAAVAVGPGAAKEPRAEVLDPGLLVSMLPVRSPAASGGRPDAITEVTIDLSSGAGVAAYDGAFEVPGRGEDEGVATGVAVNLREDPSGGIAASVGAGTLERSLSHDETHGFVMSEPSTARALGAPAEPEVVDVARKKKSDPVRSTGPVSRREVTAVAATGSFASWSAMSADGAAAPPASPVTPDEMEALEREVETSPVWVQGHAPSDDTAAEADPAPEDDPAPAVDGATGITVATSVATAPIPDQTVATAPPVEVVELAGAIAAAAEVTEARAPRIEPARVAVTEVEPGLAAELHDRTTDETAEILAQQAAKAEREGAGATVDDIAARPPVVTAAERNPAPDLLSLVAMTPKARRRQAATGADDPS